MTRLSELVLAADRTPREIAELEHLFTILELKVEAADTETVARKRVFEGSTLHNREAVFNSRALFGGSVDYKIETVTASSDTLDHTNYVVLCDCTSNNITINLPAVSGITGRVYHIKKIDSTGNAVTVDGASSENIDDATTAVITTQYESITIQSTGSEWFIL